MSIENVVLPAPIKKLIDDLANRNNPDHVRQNYRMRLDIIRREIDSAINTFDRSSFVKRKA